jgi:multidrug efflux pump subunit AcrA (membrane-fusion protein)
MKRGLYLCLLGCAVATGCSKPAQPSGPPPIAVSVGTVARRDIATYVTFNGQVSPQYQSTLSTVEAGTVDRVDATEGDFVKRGQLLASIDTSQLRAQLAANQATARESSAVLYKSNVQAPISSQQYSSAVASAQQALQFANNQVRIAEAALRSDALVYTADQNLLTKGFVAQADFEAARAAYVGAQQTLQSDHQSVASAQAALQTALTNTHQRVIDQATIVQNREALNVALANIKLLTAQIRQSSIYAPFDGQITQRLLDPGAYAGANTAILELSQTSTVYVVANVPDVDLPAVPRGKPVTFTTSSLPGRIYHATVFDVNTTPTSGTISYRVRLLQPNPDLSLRAGMLVLVTAQRAEHRNTTVVPLDAVFAGDAGSNLFTIKDNRAAAIPVTVGLETGTLAEVTGPGVHADMTVITSQPNGLADGSFVSVPAAASSPPK